MHLEKDEAYSVSEASAEPRQEYASTNPVFLAPAAESTPPEHQHSVPERRQARKVSWYRVVIEVTLDDRLQPSSGVGQRIVHAPPKLLLDLSQLASHAFADRFAPYHEAPKTVFPADMRESQKVERLRRADNVVSYLEPQRPRQRWGNTIVAVGT